MCGVVGIFGVDKPLGSILKMMAALQYRGEQGAGAAFTVKNNVFYRRVIGSVADLKMKIDEDIRFRFVNPDELGAGLGHLRYGTAGARRSLQNVQPFHGRTNFGDIFIAHNGDTPHYDQIRRELSEKGEIFFSTSDSEFILKFISLAAESGQAQTIEEAVKQGLFEYQGTFSLVILAADGDGRKLIACRDPSGNRPLALGRLNDGFVVASEDTAFEIISAEMLREIEPGEMVIISKNGLESRKFNRNFVEDKKFQCIYELIYFSFPASSVFGVSVSEFREILGKTVALEFAHYIQPNDIIMNVPDSSNAFADGFCKTISKYPTRVLVRRHLFDAIRSFTQDAFEKRDNAVREKFAFDRKNAGKKISGTRVLILDDSIVRGTTARRLIRMMRSEGASWIGLILSCPPVIGDCRKGMDFSGELVAKGCDIKDVGKKLGADFLGYPDKNVLESVLAALNLSSDDFCFGCFEGKEPIWKKW